MSVSEKTPLLNSNVHEHEEDEELSGCGSTLACNPRRFLHRYLVLIIMCFLSFGSYFCYDNPAALQDTMIKDLNLSESSFMGFYSWYSWPNVILCFFGGFLIDKVFGVRLGAIIFSLFVTVGQYTLYFILILALATVYDDIFFALGAYLNKVWLMDMARFVFGIGGESLAVAQNTYAVKWFQGRELNMVFGLQLSFSRVGSTVNMNIMQPLYKMVGEHGMTGYKVLGITLFIGGIICLLSLICALALGYFDKRADRILHRKATASDEVIRITDVKYFPLPFWLMCIICVAYYVAVFPFIGLGLVFFEMKWDLSPSAANTINSLVYIISAVASPLFGFLIDRSGKNVFWIILGTTATIGCHALLAFTFLNPFVGMICMGLAYSILASALWPLVAQVIPQSQLGTAYGIMQAIQNLGLAVVSIAAGSIVDTSGYLILEVFFLVWLCIALVAAVILYLTDASSGGKLNLSAKQRRILAEEKARLDEEKKLLN